MSSTTQPAEKTAPPQQEKTDKQQQKKKTKKKKAEKTKKTTQKKKVTTLSLQDFLADAANETKAWGERDDELDFALEPELRTVELEKREPVEEKKEEPKKIDESRIPKEGPYVVYIGNLPYSVKEQDIEAFFSESQIANISLPQDRKRGTSKGFGYVEFKTVESLKAALKKDGVELLGRKIRVDISDKPIKPKKSEKERAPKKERKPKSVFDITEREAYKESFSDKIENWRVKPADYVPPQPRAERLEKEKFRKKNDRFRQNDHFSKHKYKKEEGPKTKKEENKEEKKEPPKPVERENPFGEGKPWEPNEYARKIEEKLEKERERLLRRREERREDRRKQKEERKQYSFADVPSRSSFGTKEKKEGQPGKSTGRGFSRTFKNQQQEKKEQSGGKEKPKEKPKVNPPQKEEKKSEISNPFDVLEEVQA